MDDLYEFARYGHIAIGSVRQSLDRVNRRSPLDIDTKRLSLKLESLRLSLRVIRDTRNRHARESLITDFMNELDELKNIQSYQDTIDRISVTPALPTELYGRAFEYFGIPIKEKINADIFLSIIRERLQKIIDEPVQESRQIDLSSLENIVPQQKISPVTFEINNGILKIKRSNSSPLNIDKNNVDIATIELTRQGSSIIEQLKRSNADPRILEQVTYLHEQISSAGNPIAIGINNLNCAVMCSHFSDELPNAINALLQSYTRGIDLYLAQFPDWNRFIENALTNNIDNSDADIIDEAVDSVIDGLADNEFIDPEVPATLRQLKRWAKKPGEMTKRSAFALLRTVENFISLVFSECARGGRNLITQTVDGLTSVGSKALVAVALAAALSLTPVAQSIPELKWLKPAIEIIQKYSKDLH